MASTRRLIILILSFIVWFPSFAQEESNYWVYEIVETDTDYDVMRTNAQDGVIELVTSVPKIPDFSLSAILPHEEVVVAEKWVSWVAETWLIRTISEPINSIVADFFDRPPNSYLVQIAPSPDGSQVAMTVRHYQCTNRECFGVTQIVIVDSISRQQSILWSLAMRADSPFFPYCYQEFVYYDFFNVDTRIAQIRWTPDQTAIVASIYYDSSSHAFPPDTPLIVIPLIAPEKALVIGNGAQGWVISPDSREIASLSLDCDASPRGEDAVRITTLDLDTNQASYQNYPLGITKFMGIFDANYFQGQLVFPVAERPPNSEASWTFQLAKLNLNEDSEMVKLTGAISEFREIRSSLSGKVAVVEEDNGLLWQLKINDTDFDLLPITSAPVTYWQFANDKELVVQFEDESEYKIISINRQS